VSSQHIRTPMTRKSTSARQPLITLMRWDASANASRGSVTGWPATVWSWTRKRRRPSGWEHVTSSVKSRHTCWLCRTPQYSSQASLTTLAFCLTVSSPYGSCCCTQPALLLPAASAEIDQAVSVVRDDNKTCTRFHQQPTGLLQQSVGWCHRSAAAQTASDPECHCSSCYQSHEVRAYDTSSAQSALATCSASDHVQDSSHRVQVSPWSGTAVPHRVLLVVVTCDLPTLASSSFHARGQVTATVVSPFMVPSCGILCHTTCGQLTYTWPHSEID